MKGAHETFGMVSVVPGSTRKQRFGSGLAIAKLIVDLRPGAGAVKVTEKRMLGQVYPILTGIRAATGRKFSVQHPGDGYAYIVEDADSPNQKAATK